MKRVYIGLGSNLNEPRQQIRTAIEAISALPGIKVIAISSLDETAPVGFQDQPNFINGVLVIETLLPPGQLLLTLQQIETQQGRVRDKNNQNAPRTLDLDLLWYANQTISTETLTLPHPRMHQREFVLRPLREVLSQAEFDQIFHTQALDDNRK
jgi:2-amino-4-hydroxy-6-hydroxymethyldihydropteridine diphosphokinase